MVYHSNHGKEDQTFYFMVLEGKSYGNLLIWKRCIVIKWLHLQFFITIG